ncbi:hypothetical protein MO973_29305 [Paenibacillus sp. TRM 82003]|uniref:hypothetical protein n=1 Tax=Kineococcus sp. TRM81007 TaxID=2925831 RepID=UPI001F55D7F8|nr:hypothetical protein [Kineococcus sp. TRM81007]MCI2238921.1 hypothetical protein [Kineococcus sp. TRM81007]MCI3924328.1 hypothetical protein [Paenibacillus sp. TRM 82003]
MRRRIAALRASGATRSVWNITDQMISSANNFLVQIVIAKSVSDEDFGSFAITFAIFSVLTGFFRAAATAPVGMRFSAADDREFSRVTASSMGLVLIGGVVVGLALVGVGSLGLFPPALDSSMMALGLILPGLLLQDGWRQVLFARLRPAAACLLDATWGVLQLAAVGMLFLSGVDSVAAYVVAWGGAAFAASFVGLGRMRVLPRVRLAGAWVREQFTLVRYTVPEYVILQAGAQAAVLVAAALSTTAAAGALRGANMLTVPAQIMSTGLLSFAVPEFGRHRGSWAPRKWLRASFAVSGLVCVVAAVWGGLMLLLPDAVGLALLEETWEGTESVLLPVVLAQFGSAMSVGPAAVLYANEGARTTFRLHAFYATLVVVLTTAGALIAREHGATAQGTAWGHALAFWISSPIWFVVAHRHVRGRAAAAAAGAVGPQQGPAVEEERPVG